MSSESQAKPKKWIQELSNHGQNDTRKAIAEMLKDGTLIERSYKDQLNRNQTGLILRSVAPVQEMLVDIR